MPATTPPTESINDLVAVSRRYGGDSAFVLAGGGNTSFKNDNRLWVKASGHALATIGVDGFVELDRDALESMLHTEWPHDPKVRESRFIQQVMASRVHPELNQRPSVEALIHHLLPEAFVVHTHPGIINALTCCEHGEKLATELLGDEILWQDYVDPGVILAKTLSQSLLRYGKKHAARAPAAILLANHGFIVAANDGDTIEAISDRIISKISTRLQAQPPAWNRDTYPRQPAVNEIYARSMTRLMPDYCVVTDSSEAITRLVSSKAGRDAALSGPLTPDQIVYCRSLPLWIENPSSDEGVCRKQLKYAWDDYVSSNGFEPWVALIAGSGMITFRETQKLAEVTASIYRDAATVYHNAALFGGVCVLSTRDREFIEQWEVEAYRRSVMGKSAT